GGLRVLLDLVEEKAVVVVGWRKIVGRARSGRGIATREVIKWKLKGWIDSNNIVKATRWTMMVVA
ncbi:unnamed protein product, partial [Dovyalis caffra]